MRLKLILPTLLFFILPGVTGVFGQTTIPKKEKIFITGAVYDSETKEPLSHAQFTLHRSDRYATQSNGKFSLFGLPGDTITYHYLGYKEMHIVIPDTLRQLEYLMGVFMPKDTIIMPEIVIFPRTESTSSIVKEVKMNAEMINQAQKNVNNATVQGLTQPVQKYDADMNAKSTLRNYEMKAQYKGFLVTPENSVGVSTGSLHTHYLQFGTPMVKSKKATNKMVKQNELDLILATHEIMKMNPGKQATGKQ